MALIWHPARRCSQDKAMPNKNPWESYNPACEYQNYATMNVLESDTKDSLEMTPAEWEKCVNLPLDVQEGDFQTEVWKKGHGAKRRGKTANLEGEEGGERDVFCTE